MSEVPKISKKESIVLDLLMSNKKGEMFGLEMVEESDGHLGLTTVYTTLHRMEVKGLVESKLEDKPSEKVRRPRRLYKVSGLGETAFRRYIEEDLYNYRFSSNTLGLVGK